jgi:uncharacterized protein (TIGR00251 family)
MKGEGINPRMAKKKKSQETRAVSAAPSPPSWISKASEGVVISFKIQPKASKTEIVGLHGEPARLKVKVAAIPEDGKANRELMDFLSGVFKTAKSNFELLRGHTSSQKDILCRGVSIEEAIRVLL